MANDYFINIRAERELKEQFVDFCEKCGMTKNGAVNLMIAKAIELKSIPFEIAVCDPIGVGASKDYRFNVRVDLKTKEAFKEICDTMGISMGRVIKMYMLQCLSNGKILIEA